MNGNVQALSLVFNCDASTSISNVRRLRSALIMLPIVRNNQQQVNAPAYALCAYACATGKNQA